MNEEQKAALDQREKAAEDRFARAVTYTDNLTKQTHDLLRQILVQLGGKPTAEQPAPPPPKRTPGEIAAAQMILRYVETLQFVGAVNQVEIALDRGRPLTAKAHAELEQIVSSAIDASRAEMKEQCAKLAECNAMPWFARAIRALD